MISNVTSQYSMQSPNKALLNSQDPQSPSQTQSEVPSPPVAIEQPKKSNVPPLYKYIESNQKINLLCSTLCGVFWGLQDAKHDLEKRIILNESIDKKTLESKITVSADEFMKANKFHDEMLKPVGNVEYKHLFDTKEVSRTICKIGGKALMVAGLLYAGDYLCQKIFKNNKEYEEYYQDNLKNQS